MHMAGVMTKARGIEAAQVVRIIGKLNTTHIGLNLFMPMTESLINSLLLLSD
jgi:hypothetical protein